MAFPKKRTRRSTEYSTLLFFSTKTKKTFEFGNSSAFSLTFYGQNFTVKKSPFKIRLNSTRAELSILCVGEPIVS